MAKLNNWTTIKVKYCMAGLLFSILLLMFIEGVARIGYTINKDINSKSEDDWIIYSPDLNWEPKPNFEGNIRNFKRKFDSQGFVSADTSQISEKGKTKVVFIGDSDTFGTGVSTKNTFVEVLDNLSTNISAINLGVGGYTSFQGYQMLKKRGLQVNPDIIVVQFCYNDRRGVLNSNLVDNASTFQERYERRKMIKLAENIYLYRAISYLLRKLGIIEGNSSEVKDVRVDELYPRVSLENYRKNLVSIVDLAKRKNIYVMFMCFKDNPVYTKYLRKGINFLENLEYNLAIANLKIAMRQHKPYSWLARKYLARAYKEQGKIEEGEKVSTVKHRNWLHGGYVIYLDTEYNQIMREVAKKYDVEIIDASQVLDENPSLYLDYAHPDESGHQKIANLLYERLSVILQN